MSLHNRHDNVPKDINGKSIMWIDRVVQYKSSRETSISLEMLFCNVSFAWVKQISKAQAAAQDIGARWQ